VTGYEQSGKFHQRISSSITPESAALAHPCPRGQDALEDYRYHPPAELHDGISVGDIAQSDLGTITANSIVRGILDGTYKDVHSVLLYQRGKLVMEEYFYGYSVQHCINFAPRRNLSSARLLALPSTKALSRGPMKQYYRT